MYADVRLKEPDFERFPATTEEDQATLLKAIHESLQVEIRVIKPKAEL